MLWCVCLCECVFALHLYANIIRFNRYGSVNSKCVCVMYSCPISRWPNFFECVSESFCGCNGFPLSSYLIFLSAFQWNATQLNVHTAFFLPRTVQSMTVAVTPPIRRSYDLRPLHPGWSVQMFCVVLHIDCVFSYGKFNAATAHSSADFSHWINRSDQSDSSITIIAK